MKLVILSTLLTLNITAQAAILNSDLDSVHQKMITEAVAEKCFLSGDLSLVSSTTKVDTIDQGVQDVYYTTTFETIDLYDQVVADKYLVTVNSVKWDNYDHVNKNWGTFSVESVQCVRAN
ncbi:MAG: hypothetical protein A2622_05960 [Bdellovibrionales bacterium RIFCSPHIGHO2_01_FULL_40_29]|nr:MAG: hypothetical protein A2622_05960 [Bdellovibrionales bacterium RIFCSPHIGHO2_01_FULL_40_29]OFZ34998.1 MAG: hypothetical protein A3D17_06310 [Bdellovibrionales bacterium RIFCSPHIGHO2_02_FULL_40_15]